MPFNGSGGTSQPSGSVYPATANTLIESAKANTSIADIYTMLASVICKDGQTTTTQRIPFAAGASMGSQTITALADGTASTHAATVGQIQSGAAVALGTIAGTNTITAVASPVLSAYAANKVFRFIPANTNTGATTINIDSVGARNIFWNGAACVGGELKQGVPVQIFDDGTQFNILGNGFNAAFVDTDAVVEGSADRTKKVRIEVDGLTTATTRVITMPDVNVDLQYSRLGSDTQTGALEIATQAEVNAMTDTSRTMTPNHNKIIIAASQAGSGTALDFTGVPPGVRMIAVPFRTLSTNGTSNVIIQLGTASGVETSGYTGSVSSAGGTLANLSPGFVISVVSAPSALNGTAYLFLLNPSTFLWTCIVIAGHSNASNLYLSAGSKVLAAELDRVRVTSVSADNFDGGEVSIGYMR